MAFRNRVSAEEFEAERAAESATSTVKSAEKAFQKHNPLIYPNKVALRWKRSYPQLDLY